MGVEPAEITECEYDDGRLVRAVTRREPEWSAVDRESVLAVLERRRMIGPHGHPIDEAMSPDADPSSWDAKYKYVVLPPRRDYAQKALTDEQEAYRKKYPDADMSSLKWSVVRVEL